MNEIDSICSSLSIWACGIVYFDKEKDQVTFYTSNYCDNLKLYFFAFSPFFFTTILRFRILNQRRHYSELLMNEINSAVQKNKMSVCVVVL